MRHHLLILCSLALLGAGAFPSRGAVLYATDFSGFPVGDDQLVGYEGWQGNSLGEGVHGIGDNLVAGLGKSAWLGYGLPRTNLVSVSRSIGADDGATLPARLRLEALVGVSPSLLGGDDIFALSFYNTGGVLLAAVKFNTTLDEFGIWTDDGVTETFTSQFFVFDRLHLLALEIDFQQNVWWGYLDGAAVFQRTRFTARKATRNADRFALEWEIVNPLNPGDNWLLFDDLSLSTVIGDAFGFVPDGGRVQFRATDGARYLFQASTNLMQWTNIGTNIGLNDLVIWIDRDVTNYPHRFYRSRAP